MIQEPFLYKRTSTGKVQVWFAEIDHDCYRTTSGQLDGKKVISKWTVAKPKNTGKANETSPEAQAILEVKAMYEKQVKKGYFYDLDEIDNRQGVEPMLATKWVDRKRFLEKDDIQDVWIQPKLDGCVSGDSFVETELGTRKVCDVFLGNDKTIKSFNFEKNEIEFNRIIGKFKNAENSSISKFWIEITTESGKKIKLTNNHRLYLPTIDAWREAGDIVIGDILLIKEI